MTAPAASLPGPSRSRRSRWWWSLVLVVPTAVLGVTAHGEPQGLLVPVFGPWAGVLFGHHDCTLANQPGWGDALPLFGATLAVVLLLLRWRRWHVPSLVLVLVVGGWLFVWCAAGLLSVLNTLI